MMFQAFRICRSCWSIMISSDKVFLSFCIKTIFIFPGFKQSDHGGTYYIHHILQNIILDISNAYFLILKYALKQSFFQVIHNTIFIETWERDINQDLI